MSDSNSRRWSSGPERLNGTVPASLDLHAFGAPGHAIQQDYHLISPVSYQTGYAYPLIVWLHSNGHDARQVADILPLISNRNYLGLGVRGTRAVNLNGSAYDWRLTKSGITQTVDRVLSGIEHAKQEWNVHDQRILIGGFGTGATMACQVALHTPGTFAGVIRMAGHFPNDQQLGCDFEGLRQQRLPMLWQVPVCDNSQRQNQLQKEIVTAQWIRARVEIRQYFHADDESEDVLLSTDVLRDIDRWCFDTIINPPSVAGMTETDASSFDLVEFGREAESMTPTCFSNN